MAAPASAKATIGRRMSERELQRNVLAMAKVLGWRSAHFRPAQTVHGWRTPVQGDGAGFPDLVLLRRGRGLAIELKREGKDPETAQWEWLEAFESVPGFQAYVFRPSDWLSGRVERVLRGEA